MSDFTSVSVGFSDRGRRQKPSDSFSYDSVSVDFKDRRDFDFEIDRETDKQNFFDSLPLVFKQAYNQSIGGMMYEMINGKKRFNLNYAPDSLVRDIGAGILSFFASPEDIAITATSLGTGNLAAKGALKATVGSVSKKRAAALLRARGGLSSKKAIGIVDDLVANAAPQAFMLGVHDGLYDAAKSARDEMVIDNFDFGTFEKQSYGDVLSKVVGNAKLEKFAEGFALGGVAGLSRVAGRVGPAKIVGPLGAEMATFGAFSPIVYEGRAPEFQDFALAGGIIAGSKIASKGKPYFQKYVENLRNQKMVGETLGKENLDEILETAAKEEIEMSKKSRQGGAVIYEQATEVRDAAGRRSRIIGTVVGKDVVGGEPKIYTREQAVIANHEILSSANIVDGTIKNTKKGTTMEIELRSGPEGTRAQRYFLDENNTNKFFQFFVETDNASAEAIRVAGNALKRDDLKRNPLLIKQLHVAEFNDMKNKALNSLDGYKPDDLEIALKETADFLSSKNSKHSLNKIIDEGNLDKFDIANVDNVTRNFLVEKLYNRKQINDFVQGMKRYQETNLTYQTIGGKNTDTFSKAFRGLMPFYSSLKDPYAKRLVRVLNNVNTSVEQTVGRRLRAFDMLTTGVAATLPKPIKTLYNNYLDGVGESTAFKDFRAISSTKDMTTKKYTDKIRKDAERLSASEKQFQMARADFLDGAKIITDEIYADATGVLPRLAEYVEGYAPFMFKREVLEVLYDGIKPITKKYEELLKIHNQIDNADMLYSKEFIEDFNKEIDNILKSFSTSNKKNKIMFHKVYSDFKNSIAGVDAPRQNYQVYKLMEMQTYDKTLKGFSPLERPRTKFASFDFRQVDMLSRATDSLLEQNVRTLFGDYVSGASKRIELAKAFGATNKLYDNLFSKINPENAMPLGKLPKFLGGQALPGLKQYENEAVRTIKEVFTGEINWNQEGAGKAIEAFQTIGNIEMMGKISLGFATIPNLTQTIISTMTELGPVAGFKSIAKLFGPTKDLALRERVSQSGATLLNTIEEMLSYSPAYGMQKGIDRTLSNQPLVMDLVRGKYGYKEGIEILTQKSSYLFSTVNSWNQMIAAATAEESVKKLAKILKGEKTGLGILDALAPEARKKWATNKLGRMGLSSKEVLDNFDSLMTNKYAKTYKQVRKGVDLIDIEVTNPFKDKMLRVMKQFSTRSQLQRDFMLDPYLFNDPMIKPLLLFKRFGYRQAAYIKNVLERELIDGNVTPLLTLGIGGMAGGNFVLWAKEQLSDFITGKPEFYAKDERKKLLSKPEWSDYINKITAVGSFGVIGDIMSDEDPLSSLEFFLKPVVIDDIQRVGRAIDAFTASMQTQYPDNWDVPFRKAGVIALPIFGGVVSRAGKRVLQTEKMEKDSVRARKRDAVEAIKDAVISGQPKVAVRIMVEFNKTYGSRYPGLRVMPSDVSYTAIMKDKVERLKKQREEVEYKPF